MHIYKTQLYFNHTCILDTVAFNAIKYIWVVKHGVSFVCSFVQASCHLQQVWPYRHAMPAGTRGPNDCFL